MCIAVTATILSKSGTRAKGDCMGNIIDIELGLVSAEVGDRVLVHAGCAIQKVTDKQAEENDRIFRELMGVLDEND